MLKRQRPWKNPYFYGLNPFLYASCSVVFDFLSRKGNAFILSLSPLPQVNGRSLLPLPTPRVSWWEVPLHSELPKQRLSRGEGWSRFGNHGETIWALPTQPQPLACLRTAGWPSDCRARWPLLSCALLEFWFQDSACFAQNKRVILFSLRDKSSYVARVDFRLLGSSDPTASAFLVAGTMTHWHTQLAWAYLSSA